jgi:hypothetical protein
VGPVVHDEPVLQGHRAGSFRHTIPVSCSTS